MIITRLIGGLGNQMFQYAAGRRVAHMNKTELKLDIAGYSHQKGITPRKYMLSIFCIQEQFASIQEIAHVKKNVSRIAQILFQHPVTYIRQKTHIFDPHLLTIVNNVYLDGYWVSEKYFQDISKIIRKDFAFQRIPNAENRNMLASISRLNSIAVHVRRNDYVKDQRTRDFHGVCGLDYYQKAVSFIIKKVSDPVFFVFSDDPNWCKTNLRLAYPTIYVSHNLGKKDHEDMRLMSACKHNIIANSTFSWWGAWLTDNSYKVVVAPKKWFTDTSINTKDIVPKRWVRL